MNLVNKVKDKWAEKRFKKLEKEVIRLREDILKLPDQEGNLKTAEAIPIPANLKAIRKRRSRKNMQMTRLVMTKKKNLLIQSDQTDLVKKT